MLANFSVLAVLATLNLVPLIVSSNCLIEKPFFIQKSLFDGFKVKKL